MLAACPAQPRNTGAGDFAAGPPDRPSAAASREQSGPPPTAATIAYIGSFRGFQKPCGCAIQQSGGLLRLSTAMQQLHAVLSQPEGDLTPNGDSGALCQPPAGLALPQPLWLVECGNFANPQTRYPAPRARTHLETLAHLTPYGARAAVLGSAELQLPADVAAEAFADSPIPLVSSNLRLKLDSVRLERYIELAPQWYVAGVSSWSPASGEPPEDRWWELDDPVASVAGVLSELPAGAQVIVVATYQPGETVRALAALPVMLLVGHGSASDKQWQDEWATGYPSPPAKGLELKLLSISRGDVETALAIEPWEIALTEDWPDDAHVAGLIAAESTLVREQIRAQSEAGGSTGWRDVDWGSADRYLPDEQARYAHYVKSPPLYVGVRACRECHAAACDVWTDSRHAQALISLMRKAEHETLDCLECHVAGLLTASGYLPDDPRDEVAAVTCESCHGPASVHVGLKQLGRDSAEPGILRGSTAVCLSCHDDYNSPEFDERAYWEMIKH